MRIFRRPSGVYYVAYKEGDQWKEASLYTKDKTEAHYNLAKWTEEYTKPTETRLNVQELWDRYIPTVKEKPSYARMIRAWRQLKPFFGHLHPSNITPDLCKDFARVRTEKGLQRGTIRQELKVLKTCLNHGLLKTYISSLPETWQPEPVAPRVAYLTKAQGSSLVAACKKFHLKVFTILALTTGARVTALLDLTWDRVDLEKGIITLSNRDRTQTNKGRATVPINDSAKAVLLEAKERALTNHVVEYANGRIHTIYRSLRHAGGRAEVPWVSPHVLRHTAAVWMAEAGVPMSEISQYLGHASTAITERVYARFSPTYLRKAASALELA